MVVSSTTIEFLEDVAAASDGPKWWQLYVFDDRDVTSEMLARVVAAGYGAVCLTVDFPVMGLRHRDTRNGFVPPIGLPDVVAHVRPAAVLGRHRVDPRAHARPAAAA